MSADPHRDAEAVRAPGAGQSPRPRRVAFCCAVGLYDGKQTARGELQNLSSGGAFVAIEPPIPIGVGLSFWAPLPGGAPLLLRGHVRWTRSLPGPNGEAVGVGIQFYESDTETLARLQEWLTHTP